MIFVVPTVAVLLVVYLLISLPLRRRERARFILDLMETGIHQGLSPERTIQQVASSGDTICDCVVEYA